MQIEIEIEKIYSSGQLLHQRQVLRLTDDAVVYRVINSHAAAVIGSEHEMTRRHFEKWAKVLVS